MNVDICWRICFVSVNVKNWTHTIQHCLDFRETNRYLEDRNIVQLSYKTYMTYRQGLHMCGNIRSHYWNRKSKRIAQLNFLQ